MLIGAERGFRQACPPIRRDGDGGAPRLDWSSDSELQIDKNGHVHWLDKEAAIGMRRAELLARQLGSSSSRTKP
jgi:hypothetical protein